MSIMSICPALRQAQGPAHPHSVRPFGRLRDRLRYALRQAQGPAHPYSVRPFDKLRDRPFLIPSGPSTSSGTVHRPVRPFGRLRDRPVPRHQPSNQHIQPKPDRAAQHIVEDIVKLREAAPEHELEHLDQEREAPANPQHRLPPQPPEGAAQEKADGHERKHIHEHLDQKAPALPDIPVTPERDHMELPHIQQLPAKDRHQQDQAHVLRQQQPSGKPRPPLGPKEGQEQDRADNERHQKSDQNPRRESSQRCFEKSLEYVNHVDPDGGPVAEPVEAPGPCRLPWTALRQAQGPSYVLPVRPFDKLRVRPILILSGPSTSSGTVPSSFRQAPSLIPGGS